MLSLTCTASAFAPFSAASGLPVVKFRPRLDASDRGPHPLVLAAYAISALPTDKRRATLDELWARTKDIMVSLSVAAILCFDASSRRFQIVIERGDQEGFDAVRHAREYLLGRYSARSPNTASVVAPVIQLLRPCLLEPRWDMSVS